MVEILFSLALIIPLTLYECNSDYTVRRISNNSNCIKMSISSLDLGTEIATVWDPLAHTVYTQGLELAVAQICWRTEQQKVSVQVTNDSTFQQYSKINENKCTHNFTCYLFPSCCSCKEILKCGCFTQIFNLAAQKIYTITTISMWSPIQYLTKI